MKNLPNGLVSNKTLRNTLIALIDRAYNLTFYLGQPTLSFELAAIEI
jgi:hypothetical protein